MQVEDKVREKTPPRFEDQGDRAAYLLAEYKTPLTISVLAGVVLLASGNVVIPEIPAVWRVALTGIAAGLLPAAVISKVAIVDKFIEKPAVHVAELNLDEKTIEAHEIPKPLWKDRKQGERPPWQPEAGNIDYVVSDVEFLEDLSKLTVEGVNRELVDPVDLIVRDQRIEEVHQDLLEDVAEFERYKARERTRRLERDKELVTNLMAAIEHGLEFEPGTMEAVQDNELDEFKNRDTDRSESNRTDTDDGTMPTLNQMLGYEEEALQNGDAPTGDGGDSS